MSQLANTDHSGNPGMRDRFAGVLVGCAADDALGVPYEFAARFSGRPQMLGGGLGDYASGEYSDDTQMAVCISKISAMQVATWRLSGGCSL